MARRFRWEVGTLQALDRRARPRQNRRRGSSNIWPASVGAGVGRRAACLLAFLFFVVAVAAGWGSPRGLAAVALATSSGGGYRRSVSGGCSCDSGGDTRAGLGAFRAFAIARDVGFGTSRADKCRRMPATVTVPRPMWSLVDDAGHDHGGALCHLDFHICSRSRGVFSIAWLWMSGVLGWFCFGKTAKNSKTGRIDTEFVSLAKRAALAWGLISRRALWGGTIALATS